MSVPIVQTDNGVLRGVIKHSTEGYTYCAFKGIPYAEPPIGRLRFKDPVPFKPWSGVRDATEYGPMCGQYESRTVKGGDDCLYLNVYVKSVSTESRLPVMVWIHGGSFASGCGSDRYYGPDYLLRKDIVLVTFNYRLGVFGFLNLEDEVASGNQGFKDMVMVLKWVQQNIEKFGGDRNNVTIFGSSSGAVSVHYLVLSPLSKGLIHKAISQTGTAFCSWARIEDSKQKAIELCKILGKNLQDSKEIFDFLSSINSSRLVEAQEEVRKTASTELICSMPFAPSVDNKSLNPFMPIPVEEAALEGVHIPYLMGHNSREGIWNLIKLKKEMYLYMDENFEKAIHPRSLDVLKRYNLNPTDLRRLYFKNDKISYSHRDTYADMSGDLYFVEGVHRTLKVQAEKSSTPTYYYKFSYADVQSLPKILLQFPIAGACHYDEVEYLFYVVNLRKQLGLEVLKKGMMGYKVMQQMTEMWTNFATHGSPIPATSELLPVEWLPIDDGSNLRYLHINKELQMDTVLNIEHHFLSAKSRL